MFYNTLHNHWARIATAVIGELIAAGALNLFIVPLNFYTGGVMGACQLIRTLLQHAFALTFDAYDPAGILYFFVNFPLLLMVYKDLGKSMAAKAVICTVSYSLFCTIIPIPAAPIVSDYLTACLLGGILTGIGSGIALTCGGTAGGLEAAGLCLSKRGSHFSVGRVSLAFNAVLYFICLLLFSPEVAIYSIIYVFFGSIVMDRIHQQNINIQMLIFTKADIESASRYIMDELGRGVTCWPGIGAYTGEGLNVMCVCLSRFEIEEVVQSIRSLDEHAFMTVQEDVRVYGNFLRKLD